MSLPYDYYPAVLYAIDKIGQGRTKTAACDAANISVTTFNSYLEKHVELRDLHTEADQRGGDAMADALININTTELIDGGSDPKMAKVLSDNIKWVLARRRPKDYGDRVQVDHSISVDVAITSALDAARRRLPSTDIVDAEVTYDEDEELRQLLS